MKSRKIAMAGKMKQNQWIVYMIQTSLGTLYTGITNNLKSRFEAHKKVGKGARYFRLASPEKIVYQESCVDRSEASKRECAIKKMSRLQKLALIENCSSR